ncbi:MAG: DUF1850 domain-containing protein [Clostridia bacterium]|nr:DUF1850 domain-containing protein [Clostridia bacterium]
MKKLTVTAVVLVITAVMICFNSCKDDGVKLVLCYSENDEVIRTFDVAEGTEFSVEFIHSVNKSPVKDVFVVKEGKIFADRTIYATFGAGVQTEVEEGQTLGYDEEGNMIVSGFDMEFPRVNCIVGTVYDHVLEIGGESISLTELCGRNAHVYFELR